MEYFVTVISEGGLSTLLLGHGRIPHEKVQKVLNKYATGGWVLSFMVVEQRRFLLLWKREAVVLTLMRKRKAA